jgi:hypothetical protein
MINDPLLDTIKSLLAAHYGERMNSLILYSDPGAAEIDLLCVLDGHANVWLELDHIVDATAPAADQFPDRPFQVTPCSAHDFDTGATGLIRQAQRGTPL